MNDIINRINDSNKWIMNQPCAHWARSWHSRYGVRRNPGIFFYVFLHFKNNLKKILKSCPVLSFPIQSIWKAKWKSSDFLKSQTQKGFRQLFRLHLDNWRSWYILRNMLTGVNPARAGEDSKREERSNNDTTERYRTSAETETVTVFLQPGYLEW